MSNVTNDVIIERIQGLKELIELKFQENHVSHLRIEEQVKKTNGRVSSLENWRNRVVGAIGVIVLGAGTLFGKLFNLF